MKPCVLLAVGFVLAAQLGAEQTKNKFVYIDLKPQTNQKLVDNFAGDEGNTLASLPTGEQTLEGVKFKIGEGVIQLKSPQFKDEKPERVEGIKIGKTFARLHILHATQFGSRRGVVPEDTLIANYQVQYEDKSTENIPVVYSKDVRNWWWSDEEKEVTRGKIAWRGENDLSKKFERKIRLYLGTWENPHPAKKVMSIDYVRVGESQAGPFCVALTLEAK